MDWDRFRNEFRARPLSTVVTVGAVSLFLHFPALLLENAVIGYIDDELGSILGISKPSMAQVISFLISWILPLFLAAAVMLAYHATRIRGDSGDAATVAVGVRPRSRHEFGSSTWFLSIAAVAIFSIGQIAARGSVAGPQGVQGERGPQGPPGTPDAKIGSVVSAMARLPWLENQYLQFQRAVNEYDSTLENTLSRYKENNKVVPFSFRGYVDPSQTISLLLKEDFGQSMNFHSHPKFSENPLASVNGDKGIIDEEIRGEYRRTYEEFENSKNALEQFDVQYKQEMNYLRTMILDFGKTASGSPAVLIR